MNKESIVLGSGDLYCTEFMGTNAALPSNEVLETEENRLGHIKGGAEIEYAPSFYEAKDDMGKVIGKQGRIAKAIRTVVKSAASKDDKKVIVEILQ